MVLPTGSYTQLLSAQDHELLPLLAAFQGLLAAHLQPVTAPKSIRSTNPQQQPVAASEPVAPSESLLSYYTCLMHKYLGSDHLAF